MYGKFFHELSLYIYGCHQAFPNLTHSIFIRFKSFDSKCSAMMMKSSLLALLLVLTVSATVFQQGQADADANAQPASFRPIRLRKPGLGVSSPRPAPDPAVVKCLGAFKGAAVCLKPSAGGDCCAALKAAQEACAEVKPAGRFNPAAFLDTVMKKHCSGGDGEAPPSDDGAAPPPA